MACKYKIIKEDFFGGTPYCSLQDEFCINLRFVCDTNCQIYEDQKELEKIKSKYEQALKSVKNSLETIKKIDGNFFDEALTNEFDYMLQKIDEVLYVENN